MRVHPSALRHGIDREDAIHAATWATWIEDLDEDSPARQLRLELVIHAMKARPQMLDLLPYFWNGSDLRRSGLLPHG